MSSFADIQRKIQDVPDYQLSGMFGVSLPTVRRWKLGLNTPHPAMYPAMRRKLGLSAPPGKLKILGVFFLVFLQEHWKFYAILLGSIGLLFIFARLMGGSP